MISPTYTRPSTGSDAGDLVKRLEGDKWEPSHHRYDGGECRVITVAAREADLAAMVIYEDERGHKFVRPVEEFNAKFTRIYDDFTFLYDEAAASIAALSEELAETRCENAALHGLCDQRFEEIAALGGENERLKAAPVSPTREDVARAIADRSVRTYTLSGCTYVRSEDAYEIADAVLAMISAHMREGK